MKDQMTAQEFRQTFIDKKPTTKTAKYKNVKTVVDGIKFDSAKEAKRFAELMLLHKAKLISLPVLQYQFILVGCSYICDFMYYDYEKKEFVVEDVKSTATRKLPTYRIKNKQMKELFNIKIKEV